MKKQLLTINPLTLVTLLAIGNAQAISLFKKIFDDLLILVNKSENSIKTKKIQKNTLPAL